MKGKFYMNSKNLKTRIMTVFAGGGATLTNLKLTCHSEGTKVTEESLTRHSEGECNLVPEESKTNRFFAIAQNDNMCHPDAQKKSPLWGESGCAKRSEHTTVREGNNDDLNTLSRIRKIPAVSTTTTSPRRGKSVFTLA